MDMLVVALWVGAVVSICFVAHEYYGYWHEFQRARLSGRIPDNMYWGNGFGRRPGLEWFILNASLVPGGEHRRRKVLRGLLAFGLFCAGFVLVAALRSPTA